MTPHKEQPIEPVPPKSIAQGVINLGGFKLRTHVLDNGQRVIEADDMERFFKLLETGEINISEADATEFAKFMHGIEPNSGGE